MRAMLEAATNWIRAGLPMKRLKIVIYTRNLDHMPDENKDVVQMFEKFKTKIEATQKQMKKTVVRFKSQWAKTTVNIVAQVPGPDNMSKIFFN